MSFIATRYHDISCGHRVHGHENKCAHLHGHNYRIHFFCEPEIQYSMEPNKLGLDDVGRVIDFSIMKARLCDWLEGTWDHKFLIWDQDPIRFDLSRLDPDGTHLVNFNPTAENMARYLVDEIGPSVLKGTKVRLVKVVVEETAKCSASYGAAT